MLMHQRGGLHWLRLPSHSTVVPIIRLVPNITHPTVQLTGTRYAFNPFWLGEDVFGTLPGSPTTVPAHSRFTLDMRGRQRTGHRGELFGDGVGLLEVEGMIDKRRGGLIGAKIREKAQNVDTDSRVLYPTLCDGVLGQPLSGSAGCSVSPRSRIARLPDGLSVNRE